MAQTVHLFLKSNGKDVQGDSSVTSMGRENSIECVFLESSIATARDAGSGMATGRRQHHPLLIRKRIDKSSPMLSKALCNNEVIEGTFKFYRPNPAGDGTTQQFFTMKIYKGRIASQRLWSPDALVPAGTQEPPLEEVTFVYHTIEWTYEDGGITHQDDWGKAT
jgi:type VI secretion system secreted protein Hcp